MGFIKTVLRRSLFETNYEPSEQELADHYDRTCCQSKNPQTMLTELEFLHLGFSSVSRCIHVLYF